MFSSNISTPLNNNIKVFLPKNKFYEVDRTSHLSTKKINIKKERAAAPSIMTETSEDTEEMAFAVAMGLLTGINLIGNSLVCMVIIRNKSMRTPVNYLLLNLAITDLLVGFLSVPFNVLGSLYLHPTGKAGDTFCKFISYDNVFYICAQISALTLVGVSYERYQAVVFPMSAREKVSTKKVLIFLFVTWVFSLASNAPWFIWVYYDEYEGICLVQKEYFFIEKTLSVVYSCCTLGLPLVVMSVLYVRVIWELMKKPNQVINREQLAAQRVRIKITAMLVTVTVIFAVCWGTDTVLTHWHVSTNVQDLDFVARISTVFVAVNSSVNGFIYALFCEQFQKGIRNTFKCTRQTRNVVPISAENPNRSQHSSLSEDTKL